MKSQKKASKVPSKPVVKPVVKKKVTLVKKVVPARKPVASAVSAPASQTLRKVTLGVKASETSTVFVAGDFNAWKPTELKMSKRSKSDFSVQLALKPGAYEYKFLVDGQWQHDPVCTETVANPFGSFNSLLRVD